MECLFESVECEYRKGSVCSRGSCMFVPQARGTDAIQRLKAEILRYAQDGVELCFSTDCDDRISTRFAKIIDMCHLL